MPGDALPAPLSVGSDLAAGVSAAVLDGAALAAPDVVALELTGPGAVQCMQGVLTNDVETPGDGAFVYGALLTPKGMIRADLWVARHAEALTVFVPPEGRDAVFDVFTRSFPPRLARPLDVSAERAVLRLVGPGSREAARGAGVSVPEPGRCAPGTLDDIPYLAARPSLDAPFALQLSCALEQRDALASRLEDAGTERTTAEALELRRILDGWPRLGSEIVEKTLPQEVRYDAIEGVSYTKGCYTGQETVARVHFRGHANRWLAGLLWDTEPDPANAAVRREAATVGRVSSMAWVPELEAWLGLGLLRHEVTSGTLVEAAGALAEVCDLPFESRTA